MLESTKCRLEFSSKLWRAAWISGTPAICFLVSIASRLLNQFLILANRSVKTLFVWWVRSIELSSKSPKRLCLSNSSIRCVSKRCTLGVASLLKYSRYLAPNHFAANPNYFIVSSLWIVVRIITDHRKSKASINSNIRPMNCLTHSWSSTAVSGMDASISSSVLEKKLRRIDHQSVNVFSNQWHCDNPVIE